LPRIQSERRTPLLPRHPGVRSEAEPAGTQTSFSERAREAFATTGDQDALFISLTVDWIPAFAGMTVEGRGPATTAGFEFDDL